MTVNDLIKWLESYKAEHGNDHIYFSIVKEITSAKDLIPLDDGRLFIAKPIQ